MKILVFIENFAPPTYTFIFNELNTLSMSNDVVVLTTNKYKEQFFPFDHIVEIPFYENDLEYRIRKTLRSRDYEIGSRKSRFAKKIQKFVADFQPDIIHCHFGYESWVFLLNFPIGKIPIFLHFHGFDASHKLKSQRYCNTLSKVLERPDLNPIFVSDFMHHTVEKHLNKSIEKWFLLYYGTDCKFFERVSNLHPKNPFKFLQISSFAEKKGHEYTIKAFSQLLKKHQNLNVKLVFAGSGILFEEMQNLVNSLDIQDFVCFVGLVNREQAKELMEESHCFVHHSVISKTVGDMEGIPNAIMEAMAMELPIISTYHSGIPELVETGVNGFLVNERDIDAYVEAMEKILTWDYLPRNREKVKLGFEKIQHGELLISYYKNAIEKMKKDVE